MTRIGVTDFVRDDTGQLGFILRNQQQSFIDVNITSGSGERIDGGTVEDKKIKFERCPGGLIQNQIADTGDIICEHFIMENHLMLF